MDTENTDIENKVTDEPIARRHHRKPDDKRGNFFVVRQILNILFMLGAVAGCVVYVKVNDQMGAILIIIAMAFKMAECVLRFKK